MYSSLDIIEDIDMTHETAGPGGVYVPLGQGFAGQGGVYAPSATHVGHYWMLQRLSVAERTVGQMILARQMRIGKLQVERRY